MGIHPPLEDLTRAVHGLGPIPDHVDLCAKCVQTLERLREERDLLRRTTFRQEDRTGLLGKIFRPRG